MRAFIDQDIEYRIWHIMLVAQIIGKALLGVLSIVLQGKGCNCLDWSYNGRLAGLGLFSGTKEAEG